MDIAAKIDLTVEWLRDKVASTGVDGLVIGLSGGIDSSVCAALMVRAVQENAYGVIMPIKSLKRDRSDAVALAEAIDMNHFVVDLSNEHELIFNKVAGALTYKDDNKRLADANLRARLRMSTLYTVANLKNCLVVGTDNAAELYTGYFTKYGDGGVDILPIAHLSKGEVYQWGECLGVPAQILKREPSAGLWQGQTDEGEMGTTYRAIDAFLRGESIPQEDLQIIERMHRRSAHKRTMPPQGPTFK